MSDVRGESLPILYGRSTATGELVHVDDAPNGKACGCVCPDPGCGQPLIARNNGKKKIHHFAHIDGTCAWSAEYLLAKVKAKIAELDHWTDKQETKAAVDNLIRDTLWAELPESYTELSISEYRRRIYEYVYVRYKEVA